MRSIFLLSPLSVILLLPVLVPNSWTLLQPFNPVDQLFALVPELSDPASPKSIRATVSLVTSFHSSCAQLALTSTFNQLAIVHTSLQSLASLLESLGACSTKQAKRTRFRSSTRGVRDAQRRALRYPISSRLAAGIVRCTTFHSRPGGTCHS